MAFVYAGHGVFPSIRASMREPERFPQVWASCSPEMLLICYFLYNIAVCLKLHFFLAWIYTVCMGITIGHTTKHC